jgi:hypothetical protein
MVGDKTSLKVHNKTQKFPVDVYVSVLLKNQQRLSPTTSIKHFPSLYLCPPTITRRKGQYVGRVFLMLNYTDITQNTYIQSLTVTEIMAIEKCGLLWGRRTVCHL